MTEGRLLPAHQVVEAALEASHSNGTVVIVEDTSQADVRFANSTVTTDGLRNNRRVTVISFTTGTAGTSVGVASRTGAGDVTDLVRSSEADSKRSAPSGDESPLVGLSDAASVTDTSAVTGFENPAETIGLSAFGNVLSDLGEAFKRARAEKRILSGYGENEITTVYLGTSTGLRLRHAQPTGRLQLVARRPDGSGSAWAGIGTSTFDGIELGALEEKLIQRLKWAERKVEIPAGRYDTILPPDAVADMMITLAEAASGRDAEDGQNVFASHPTAGAETDATNRTRIGEALSPHPLNLYSDPVQPGLECIPFVVAQNSSTDTSVFDNGLPLNRTPWIDQGRLKTLRYHRAGARASKTEAAPSVDNLILELPGATASEQDLVAGMERGLLLTCLWYIREVDPTTLLLTGLTRDGVYLVEDGEVVAAANNFRFNESPVDLIKRATHVGRSQRALSREWGEWLCRTSMPPLRIPDFNMSSVSPAI